MHWYAERGNMKHHMNGAHVMLSDRDIYSATLFHYSDCRKEVGPRGGVKMYIQRARRNGATKYWKTRPGEFRIPVKKGFRRYGYIDQTQRNDWHNAATCPVSVY